MPPLLSAHSSGLMTAADCLHQSDPFLLPFLSLHVRPSPAANHRKPAVVTLSLGIQVGSWSRVLEDAVRSLINDHGVNVMVASGNSGVDACYVAPGWGWGLLQGGGGAASAGLGAAHGEGDPLARCQQTVLVLSCA